MFLSVTTVESARLFVFHEYRLEQVHLSKLQVKRQARAKRRRSPRIEMHRSFECEIVRADSEGNAQNVEACLFPPSSGAKSTTLRRASEKMLTIQSIACFLMFLLQAVLTVGAPGAYKQLINEGGAVACD